MLKMFGLGEGSAVADATAVGWGKESEGGDSGDVSSNDYIQEFMLTFPVRGKA
jgi:hypothetical protein